MSTVDAEAERLGVERIDLLKTDTEGYELEVLRGAAGLLGGEAGAPARFTIDGRAVDDKAVVDLARDSVLTVEAAGGGGYGPPEERDPEQVANDIRLGYTSV